MTDLGIDFAVKELRQSRKRVVDVLEEFDIPVVPPIGLPKGVDEASLQAHLDGLIATRRREYELLEQKISEWEALSVSNLQRVNIRS